MTKPTVDLESLFPVESADPGSEKERFLREVGTRLQAAYPWAAHNEAKLNRFLIVLSGVILSGGEAMILSPTGSALINEVWKEWGFKAKLSCKSITRIQKL